MKFHELSLIGVLCVASLPWLEAVVIDRRAIAVARSSSPRWTTVEKRGSGGEEDEGSGGLSKNPQADRIVQQVNGLISQLMAEDPAPASTGTTGTSNAGAATASPSTGGAGAQAPNKLSTADSTDTSKLQQALTEVTTNMNALLYASHVQSSLVIPPPVQQQQQLQQSSQFVDSSYYSPYDPMQGDSFMLDASPMDMSMDMGMGMGGAGYPGPASVGGLYGPGFMKKRGVFPGNGDPSLRMARPPMRHGPNVPNGYNFASNGRVPPYGYMLKEEEQEGHASDRSRNHGADREGGGGGGNDDRAGDRAGGGNDDRAGDRAGGGNDDRAGDRAGAGEDGVAFDRPGQDDGRAGDTFGIGDTGKYDDFDSMMMFYGGSIDENDEANEGFLRDGRHGDRGGSGGGDDGVAGDRPGGHEDGRAGDRQGGHEDGRAGDRPGGHEDGRAGDRQGGHEDGRAGDRPGGHEDGRAGDRQGGHEDGRAGDRPGGHEDGRAGDRQGAHEDGRDRDNGTGEDGHESDAMHHQSSKMSRPHRGGTSNGLLNRLGAAKRALLTRRGEEGGGEESESAADQKDENSSSSDKDDSKASQQDDQVTKQIESINTALDGVKQVKVSKAKEALVTEFVAKVKELTKSITTAKTTAEDN